jgi:hypothetical protein
MVKYLDISSPDKPQVALDDMCSCLPRDVGGGYAAVLEKYRDEVTRLLVDELMVTNGICKELRVLLRAK